MYGGAWGLEMYSLDSTHWQCIGDFILSKPIGQSVTTTVHVLMFRYYSYMYTYKCSECTVIHMHILVYVLLHVVVRVQ